ncbi:hypothetical protein SS50377_23770 [Spironucleus salmonicida]|uniref:Uncharacterized protein n=1 Tax=Spironucleus salmonicida TaxID=348837 RepID=A0A9P8LT13_9EUKA|nr:hypothetical protein SS50377_23770 [Spironucleus salmonicida]
MTSFISQLQQISGIYFVTQKRYDKFYQYYTGYRQALNRYDIQAVLRNLNKIYPYLEYSQEKQIINDIMMRISLYNKRKLYLLLVTFSFGLLSYLIIVQILSMTD